jgi:uncharacterized protein
MTPRLNIITLGVADVARAKAFYTALGFKPHSMSNEHIGFFEAHGLVLSVYGHSELAADAKQPPTERSGFRGVTVAWNEMSPAAVDQALAHAVTCGATLVKPAEQVFWGGYSGYFADPDGHLWEVAHNPFVTIDANQRLVLP